MLGGYYGDPGVNNMLFIALFNAGWFIESLCTQTLVIHLIRTPKVPFVQSVASRSVIISTVFALIIGIVIPYTNFGERIGMTLVPAIYFLYLIGIIFAYMMVVTIIKKIYIKKYGELL